MNKVFIEDWSSTIFAILIMHNIMQVARLVKIQNKKAA